MKTALVLIVLLATSVARADDAPATDGKSEDVATALAVGGSLVGPATLYVAFRYGNDYREPLNGEFWEVFGAGCALTILAPSAGQWYAGAGWTPGLTTRLVGGAAIAVGSAMFVNGVFGSDGEAVTGGGIVIAGAAAVAIGTGLDVWGAHTTARLHNARVHATVVPMAAPGATGLSVVGTF